MSAPPSLRRKDKAMPEAQARAFLEQGYCGRLATLGPDGYPYCVPLLYLVMDGKVYLHNARATGHLRDNVQFCEKACFEVDEAGPVFDYGRFECDSTLAYQSVILFGEIRIVEDEALQHRFFDALMAKYRTQGPERPKSFYPRMKDITVYEMTIERLTGKVSPLFDASEQWPAKDRTKTPNAVPPGSA